MRNFIHDLNPDPAGYDYIGIRGENQKNANTLVKSNTLYRVQGTGINIIGTNWLVEGNEVSHSLDANTDTGLQVGGDSDAVRFFGSGHVIRNNYLHDNLDTEQFGSPHIDCFQTFSVCPNSQYADKILIEGNYCDNMGQMLMIEDSSEINGTGNAVHHITFRNNIFRRAVPTPSTAATPITSPSSIMWSPKAITAVGGWWKTPTRQFITTFFTTTAAARKSNDNASKIGTVWDYNIHYPDFLAAQTARIRSAQPVQMIHIFESGPGGLSPRVNSPAIDRGTALSGFNYDIDGILRPQITTWDIGASEIVPQVVLTGISGDQSIHLAWAVNLTLPVTITWQIEYIGLTGDQPSRSPVLPAPPTLTR